MALLRRKAKSEGKPLEERAALERRIEGLSRSPFLQKTVTDPTPAEATVAAETVAAEMSQQQARNLAQQRLDGLAQKTAGQGGTGVAPGRSAAGKAAKTGRTGSKLRERAKPQRLKSDFRELLLWLNASALDLPVERLFFAPTKTPLSIATLSVQSENKALAHDYRATPTLVFDCALSAVKDDLSRFNFVDYGAGKGRVLLLASQHPFRRIVGVELAEELHDDALMNIAQFPRSRMKCRNVECLLDDAVNIEAIDGEAIHYFFDPFDRQIFAQVLSRIAQSYHAHPRRLYLILVDTDAADLIHRTGIFQKVDLPFIDGLKARLLSPYPISVYRSLA